MKGIILAGGSGSRLRPLTRVVNKHLLPVYDRPMIQYPIGCLVGAGVDEICIVTGAEHISGFREVLGDGRELGVRRLDFAAQARPAGVADALLAARDCAGGGRICVALGDNIFERDASAPAAAFRRQRSGARVLLAPVKDGGGFGVARLDQSGRLRAIVEKPGADGGDAQAVVGLYFYDSDAFDLCRTLRPSARGELEITDLNNAYLRRGDLEHQPLEGWWADAGTFESLHRAACLVAAGGANHPPAAARAPGSPRRSAAGERA